MSESFVLAASQVDLRIPNPFLKYTQTKPSEWPGEIVQQVVGSSMLQALGDIPQSSTVPHAKDDSTPFNVSAMQRHLRRVEAYRDNPRSLTSKEMRYDVERLDKTLLVNNRERYIVNSVAGCSVGGVPIFHYTHATFRFECRRPEFEERAPGLLEHHEQNDEILDAMDLATLITLAQGQREMGVEVPVYIVYVLYLSETYKDLNVVTAAIPVTTIAAIENGEHSIHKIKVDRGMIPIDIDYEKPLWDNILVKMLDSFLDYGVELAKLLPQPPYDYEQD
ncbi:hypothetical protein Hypma_004432 [Hypsizygus marmoreus]|uniref:Uncharacterized protein n=1 Tax=Hypsizygus marmoreus TaxID=39966 RepID=A0A369K3I5_HYPMA|nr:hypothetical protein Hypma_004432 [Hypsizygus marmoreus]